ncbi:MAG: hypothetical protein A3D87_07265 [Omnitrophica WOR_2 bacterium RIFCSPHIGHO2_02_FULL_50_17]|nr:MAG: hypothetical protein A3D87_07265 [Omnitrophica WOR_2 bacterium RIFCSPHIGHO2_02_FULL_50_17]
MKPKKPKVHKSKGIKPPFKKSPKTALRASKKAEIPLAPKPVRGSPAAGERVKPARFLWLKKFFARARPRRPLPITERIKKEFLSFSRLFKKKLERFLVVNFDPTITEVLYVEPLADKLRLLAYDVQKLPSSDKENKEEAVFHFIEGFLKQNAIVDRDVIISISDADSIFVKDLILPVMSEEEILKAAKWQLKDDVLFDLEKASIDWRALEEFAGEDGVKGVRTIFIVANDEVVNRYLSMIQKCQLDPLCVTTGAFNYTHILEKLPETPKAVAILDVGHTESTFGIYMDNKLNFVRRLPISWEKLMQSLTKVLVSDGGVTQFTYEEAEEITRTVGIPENVTETVRGNVHASHLMSLMRPLLETLVREIKFSLDYFAMNFEKERPSLLYITGDSSNLKNLDKYLSKEFSMNVSYLSLPSYVDTAVLEEKEIEREDRNKIINAIGAALGGLRAINLLPFDIKAKKLEVVEKAFLRFVSIVMGAILLFSLFVMQFQVHNYQNRIRSAQIHLKTMEDVKNLIQKVKEKEGLVTAIEGNRVPVEGLLKTISAAIPDEIVLDILEFNPHEHRLMLKGTVLAGGEAAEAALSNFLQKLESSLFFTEASFVSSQRSGVDYKFEIKCDVFH